MILSLLLMVLSILALITIFMVLAGYFDSVDMVMDNGFKRKTRNVFGLPWSFTQYWVKDDVMIITTGWIHFRLDEVKLYRIFDLSLTESVWQQMTHTGDIIICSADKSMGDFVMKNIADPKNVLERLSSDVERAREEKGIAAREVLEKEVLIESNGNING